jgi:signal transduction histidine kinase
LRMLTAHLQNVREEERKRIGREIHDELGQQLTAIKMDVAWIDKKITDEDTGVKGKLKNVIELLDGSNKSIRRILSELRPGILDDYNLLDAIDWLGNQFTINTGIPLNFTTTETSFKYASVLVTCIFRVYQEALTNITRYAGATKVLASLTVNNGIITVSIEDNGKGFVPESIQAHKSFGILGMKERVLSLGGSLN